MDLIGSKAKLVEWIFSIIGKVSPPMSKCVFLDACCGSGVVSRHAASLGYTVISNDVMEFPRAIANGSIGLDDEQKIQAAHWIDRLNTLDGMEGFFYQNFCSNSNRLYFTPKNAAIIDHIRFFIDMVEDPKIKDYLIYCGIEALSRVSNTAGTHGAFLKKIKSRANDRFILRNEKIVNGSITSYSQDILNLLKDSRFKKRHKEDIIYIDPPYTSRQYPPNYHLYEDFAKNDSPIITGKTGLRNKWKEEGGSLFCNSKSCMTFLNDILSSTRAKYVFLSYSSDGILDKEEIISAYPKTILHTKLQRRYRSDISDKRKYDMSDLNEYLFQIPL